MLTEKQNMKSRAVEEREKIQRERMAIAETLTELEQREQCTHLSDGEQHVYALLALRKSQRAESVSSSVELESVLDVGIGVLGCKNSLLNEDCRKK